MKNMEKITEEEKLFIIKNKNKVFDEKMYQLNQKARLEKIKKDEIREENERKNLDFVQWMRGGMDAYMEVNAKSAIAGNIFVFLAKRMKKDNKIIVSRETLREYFGVSRAGISNAIKILVESNMIKILKTGNANIYCLNANVVWSTYYDKKEYAEFVCQVFISKKEQIKLETKNVKVIGVKNEKI